MDCKKYKVTLIGTTPLLMHRYNIKWEERIKAWARDPQNKSVSIPGDCRTPAWGWIGCCYFADGLMVLESDNLMAMLRDAGKKTPAAKGKGSLKAATQSGILVNEIGWPVVTKKGVISQEDVMALKDEYDFKLHEELANEMGFELFVKPARVGAQKHIRVRPRFDSWTLEGSITVFDVTLSTDVIKALFVQAGRYIGIGDWRPGSPMPGNFGMFDSKIEAMK